MNKGFSGLGKCANERSEKVRIALEKAQEIIVKEIEANAGVYPFHGGRLSQAELCRRASIAQVTLQNPSHRDTTLPKVNAWLLRVNALMVSGRKSVRRTVTERVDSWKCKYEQVATHYNISRLDVADLTIKLLDREIELAASNKRILELEIELSRVRAAKSGGNIIRMPTTSK
jgi:hypothetical protein